jgi:hypothetical protein
MDLVPTFKWMFQQCERALLTQAVEAEVAALLSEHADKPTADGRQRLVRHGHLPERKIVTGIGPVTVRCRVCATVLVKAANASWNAGTDGTPGTRPFHPPRSTPESATEQPVRRTTTSCE